MTSGSAGSKRSNSSISRVRTDVRSSPAVRRTSAISRSNAAATFCCRISTSAAANAASMSSGAASAAATTSGCRAEARGQEGDLAHRALGLFVIGLGVQDRLVGGLRGVEVTGVQIRTGLRQFGVDLLGLFGVGAAAELSGGRVQQRVDPTAQLVGRLHALEARQRLAPSQGHHGRDGLHTEDLGHPGRRVDVHGGQRPLAAVVGGQARQRVAQLDARIAARATTAPPRPAPGWTGPTPRLRSWPR